MTTYCDSSKKSFGYISHNDTNEENNGIQPEIVKNKCYDEKWHTQEDGYTSNQMNKMGNFLGNRGISNFQSWSQVGNSTHDSLVTSSDHHSTTGT